jgi:hypothetical protein
MNITHGETPIHTSNNPSHTSTTSAETGAASHGYSQAVQNDEELQASPKYS